MLTGIIGGTGFETISQVVFKEERTATTQYGAPSSALRFYDWPAAASDEGVQYHSVVSLSRHGLDHTIPPHRVNYRANIMALKQAGVERLIGVYAVGGIHRDMQALGQLVIPDQIIDYTYGRSHTFWDNEGPMCHVDMTEPYSAPLRQALIAAADRAQMSVCSAATYACTNGPRLETAAEIRRLAQDGCDIVGMTGMPEAALAREAGLTFAAVCVVVNPAAGLITAVIDQAMITDALRVGKARFFALFDAFLGEP